MSPRETLAEAHDPTALSDLAAVIHMKFKRLRSSCVAFTPQMAAQLILILGTTRLRSAPCTHELKSKCTSCMSSEISTSTVA